MGGWLAKALHAKWLWSEHVAADSGVPYIVLSDEGKENLGSFARLNEFPHLAGGPNVISM